MAPHFERGRYFLKENINICRILRSSNRLHLFPEIVATFCKKPFAWKMKRALVQAAHRVIDVFCVVLSSHSENTRKRRRLHKTEDLTFDPADRYSCQPAPVKPKKKRGKKTDASKFVQIKIFLAKQIFSFLVFFLSHFLQQRQSLFVFFFRWRRAGNPCIRIRIHSTCPKNKKDIKKKKNSYSGNK